ncbi:MAG: hypothetical protein FD131_3442 [Rhodocyclaceae bacterium]|nr:MAG: hypothetical protein FD131_3442 [Rhodocyclaceae bacterium]
MVGGISNIWFLAHFYVIAHSKCFTMAIEEKTQLRT